MMRSFVQIPLYQRSQVPLKQKNSRFDNITDDRITLTIHNIIMQLLNFRRNHDGGNLLCDPIL